MAGNDHTTNEVNVLNHYKGRSVNVDNADTESTNAEPVEEIPSGYPRPAADDDGLDEVIGDNNYQKDNSTCEITYGLL